MVLLMDFKYWPNQGNRAVSFVCVQYFDSNINFRSQEGLTEGGWTSIAWDPVVILFSLA